MGDHLRARRLDLVILQAAVATQLGVDETTVYNWENGRAQPSLEYLPKIVKFLGYSPLPEPRSPGENLVLYRKIRGLSQKQMAHRLGVDPSTLARWERGERQPTGQYLQRVRALLG